MQRLDVRSFESALLAQMCPIRVHPMQTAAESFSSSVHGADIGGLRFIHCFSSTPLMFEWEDYRDLERTDTYRLHVQDQGHSIYRHSQRDVHCSPQSIVLIKSGTEREAAQLSAAGAKHVVIPGPLLRTYVADVDHWCGKPLNGASGIACVLRELIDSIWEQQRSIGRTERHGFVPALLSLVASTFRTEAENGPTDRLNSQYKKIIQVIATHYNNGDFSIRMASSLLNMSARSIQAVMTSHRTSFSAELMRERLARSRDLLSQGHMPVTEVAFECGFQNLSHFSRTFRSHFGVPPSEVRHSARSGSLGVSALQPAAPASSQVLLPSYTEHSGGSLRIALAKKTGPNSRKS